MKVNVIMKMSIFILILIVLLSGIFFYMLMRQNHNHQKLESEYESLQKRLTAVEIQPQTGQDDEKTKLATQLADANTKLINTDFGKFERELRNSNNKWLRDWTAFFVAIVAIVVTVIGFALWFSIKSMISDKVEEHLKGFQKAFDQVNELKDELGILEKEHAISVLEEYPPGFLTDLERHTERIKAITDDVLLNIFCDKTRDFEVKWRSAEVLVVRETPQFVSPALEFLNSIVDSEMNLVSNFNFSYDPRHHLCSLVVFVGKIHTLEAYNGLKSFLNLLLSENPENKDLFIGWTAHSLASISVALNKRDSISILIESIPQWDFVSEEHEAKEDVAKCFHLLNEPEGIKEIYNVHAKGKIPDLEEKCLEILEEHDTDFVKEQREENTTDNTESNNN